LIKAQKHVTMSTQPKDFIKKCHVKTDQYRTNIQPKG